MFFDRYFENASFRKCSYHEEDFFLNHFKVSLNDGSTNGTDLASVKFRSWSVPYKIDLMNLDEKGSAEARGSVFSLGQQLSFYQCQNDTDIPWIKTGRISQDFTLFLRSYKLYDWDDTLIATAQENMDWTTNIDVFKAENGVATSQIIASLKVVPFQLTQTWEITIKSEIPSYDYRQLVFLVSIISYNYKK